MSTANRGTDYTALARSLERAIPKARIATDPLRTLSYGTDASFYRLVPKIVVTVENEAEVIAAMAICAKAGAPVTFRAAGTSLSGQAISDSVLLVLGDGWQGSRISEGGFEIALQPGVIGAEANRRLAPHGRKIGPDPASIAAAMIGGIAANNASGMCCGTAQNSYKTLKSMRVLLAGGASSIPAAKKAVWPLPRPILACLRVLPRLPAKCDPIPCCLNASSANSRSRTRRAIR